MNGIHPSALFVPEIKELLQQKAYRELKVMLGEMSPIDLAEAWHSFSQAEQVVLFKLLSSARAGEVFEELETDEQMFLLSTLETGALGPVLEDMDPREVAKLFHRLPDRQVRKMMSQLRREQAERVTSALSFPEGTAGSLMHTNVFILHPQMTVEQSVERLRASIRLHKMGELHTTYVTDEGGRLVGSVAPQMLIAAPSRLKIAEIMTPCRLFKVRADADQEQAAATFSKYKLVNAPVVDDENRLLGVLSVDDILHVVSEEATEDIAKMAGTEAEELESGSVFTVVKLRMPWLLASWAGGIVASFVIARFETTLSQIVALAAFMPVISGMGGNVGTQSSTIVVRGLATGHIQVAEIARVVWRELRIGVTLGLGYGVLLSVLAFVQYKGSLPVMFPLVVGLGIATSMTVAAIMGALTPMLVHRMKVDPAVCSAPFVSTATDIISLFTYFAFATLLLL